MFNNFNIITVFYIILLYGSLMNCVSATPYLIAICRPLEGFNVQYGISSFDRLDNALNKKPLPDGQEFRGPTKDGQERDFTIEVYPKKLKIQWHESERERKNKEVMKKLGTKTVEKAIPAEYADIFYFTSLQISASRQEDGAFESWMYTIYPDDGIVSVAHHFKDVGSSAIFQWSLYARCVMAGRQ